MRGPSLVLGGAGFIGTNVADRLLGEGREVIVFDSLARAGVDRNLEWLRAKHGPRVEFVRGDVRNRASLRSVVERAGEVFHLAAQVAVTTSLLDPIDDFERNALGTLNLLEELRRLDTPPPLVFTSTNKVYGGLEDISLTRKDGRYKPEDPTVRRHGIGEDRPLDFHSPYGCSKGAADQYVIDYARTFGLPAVVFRMSCIYGSHQCGTEDQGWVAHFLIQALRGNPITIYGDGGQVRDILYAADLVDAFRLALDSVDRLKGQAFNMGGGPANTISLLEFLDTIETLNGKRPNVAFGDWRPGDQRYYVSDTSKFSQATGWTPKHSARHGIEALYRLARRSSGAEGGGVRAAQVVAPGKIEIVEVPIPEPGPQEVRVKLEGCGVCASNIPPWEGREWFSYPMEPGGLGHEGWGVVDAVGTDVPKLKSGDRIAFISGHAYAEYDLIAEDSAIRLPEELDGVPFPGEPLGCAMNIFRRAHVAAGDTVAIVGIGFLGALLTRLCANAGAKVVAVARKDEALAIARTMGAAETIRMDDHWTIVQKVKDLTDNQGADVVIEAVGKQGPLDLATDLTREMGRLVIAGYHQDGLRTANLQQWGWKGLEVTNAHEREAAVYLRGIGEAIGAVANGRLDPAPLYTHRFPLEGLGTALDMTKDRPAGFMKALVEMA